MEICAIQKIEQELKDQHRKPLRLLRMLLTTMTKRNSESGSEITIANRQMKWFFRGSETH